MKLTEKIYLARSSYYYDRRAFPNLLYIGLDTYNTLVSEKAQIINGHYAGMEIVIDTNNPKRLELGYVQKVWQE